MTRDEVLAALAGIIRNTAMSPQDIDAMQQTWLEFYPNAALDIMRVCNEMRASVRARVDAEPTEEQHEAAYTISDQHPWRAVCKVSDVARLLAQREAALKAKIEKLEMELAEERNGGEG